MNAIRIVASMAFALALWSPAAHGAEAMEVVKSSGCVCCERWIRHVEAEGYEVEARNLGMSELMEVKAQAGVTSDLASCHTAMIDGYVIEGHVPAEDIARLLEEEPEALGLAVPGMPQGSPGMETGQTEPYQVLLINQDGSTEVFAEHG